LLLMHGAGIGYRLLGFRRGDRHRPPGGEGGIDGGQRGLLVDEHRLQPIGLSAGKQGIDGRRADRLAERSSRLRLRRPDCPARFGDGEGRDCLAKVSFCANLSGVFSYFL
jgi:hypothetical protein